MAGNSLIEKSYKLLFIIYAPFAIVTYLLKSVGGFEVSFIGLFTMMVSGISVIIGLYVCILYAFKRNLVINSTDFQKDVPFVFRHDFLVPHILITIVSLCLTIYLSWSSLFPIVEAHEEARTGQKTRIALLLSLPPLTTVQVDEDFRMASDYGYHQLEGLATLFRLNPEYTDQFDFALLNHGDVYDEHVNKLVIEEVRKGTRYFVTTSSTVSVGLSKNFESLIDTLDYGDVRPILISTLSSSPEVFTKKNSVYRFFIRSTEESALLAQKAAELGFTKASFISLNDEFGKGATEAFVEAWTKTESNILIQGVYYDPITTADNLKLKIEESKILSTDPEVLFIAGYDQPLTNLISALQEINAPVTYLYTSNVTSGIILDEFKEFLKSTEWYTTVPFFNAYNKLLEEDIEATFIFLTLNKLIKCIQATAEDPSSFDVKMSDTSFPPTVDFQDLGNGDFAVKMRVLESDYFMN